MIARLIWEGREEMVPGWAIRWTSDRVMVVMPEPNPGGRPVERIAWLRADDVYRTVPRRT